MTEIINRSDSKTLKFCMSVMPSPLGSLPCPCVWFEQVEMGSQSSLQEQLTRWGVCCCMGSSSVDKRNSDKQWMRDRPSFSPACMAHLTVWTKHLARQFDEGWYGALRMCVIPFHFKNWVNLSDVNWGPLPETSWSGRPKRANTKHRASVVWSDVVADIGMTSGYFSGCPIRWTFSSGMVWQSPHVLFSRVCQAITNGYRSAARLDMQNTTLSNTYSKWPEAIPMSAGKCQQKRN